MIDYVLFDLDGTLTDPKVGITTCVQYALKSFGIEEEDLDALTPFIGPPLKDSFMEFYDFDEEKAQQAIGKYRERFQDIGIFENEIYEGIPELIRKLKGNHKKIAVASSKPTVFVERILEHFEIRKYFDVVVGSELDGTRTDKAEVVREALRQLYGETEETDQKRKNTVMVGDRKFDIEGAKAEGLESVAVTYGYGKMDELRIARPDHTVKSVAELEQLLLKDTQKKPVSTPPMTKLWFIIFPALVFYFVREIGYYIAIFFLTYLAGVLPRETAEKLIIWDETGETLVGATGNGAAIRTAIAFVITGIITWKFFAKAELTKAEADAKAKPFLLNTSLSYVCMALGAIGMALGFNFLYELLGITGSSKAYQEVAEAQYAAAIPIGLILNGLLVPFVEEMLFRGVVYNRMKKHMKYTTAIIFSALCFGVYHQNYVQGSYAFLMGIVIAFLYEKFGHFYIAFIVHAVSNITAYLLTAWSVSALLPVNWVTTILFLAVGLGALGYCFITAKQGEAANPILSTKEAQ